MTPIERGAPCGGLRLICFLGIHGLTPDGKGSVAPLRGLGGSQVSDVKAGLGVSPGTRRYGIITVWFGLRSVALGGGSAKQAEPMHMQREALRWGRDERQAAGHFLNPAPPSGGGWNSITTGVNLWHHRPKSHQAPAGATQNESYLVKDPPAHGLPTNNRRWS
jgi:hypothetical protein